MQQNWMQHNTERFLWIESMPLEVIGGVMGFLHTFLQLQISKWSTPLCNKVPCRSNRWSQRASNHFQISTVFFSERLYYDSLSNRHLHSVCCFVEQGLGLHFSLYALFFSKASENRTLCSTRFVIPEIAWKDRTSMDFKQWTGNPMLMAPKVWKIGADHPLFQSFSPHLNEATLPRHSEKSDEKTTGLFLLANQLNFWKSITDWCPCKNTVTI